LTRKGYKSETVTQKDHEDIKNRDAKTILTIREYVEYMLAKYRDSKEKQ